MFFTKHGGNSEWHVGSGSVYYVSKKDERTRDCLLFCSKNSKTWICELILHKIHIIPIMAEPLTISDLVISHWSSGSQAHHRQLKRRAPHQRGLRICTILLLKGCCASASHYNSAMSFLLFDSILRAALPSMPPRVALEEEIASLLSKEAIMTVPQPEAQRGFVSRVWCFKAI